MSFLDKLKVKVEEANTPSEEPKKDAGTAFLQLDVDILQTADDIIIIAPIPGVEVSELDISIENENDVVTIKGRRDAPEILDEEEHATDNKYLRQECQWGQFYRQIILPQEINVSEVEAKFRKGILILRLPLLRLQNSGKKKIEVSLG